MSVAAVRPPRHNGASPKRCGAAVRAFLPILLLTLAVPALAQDLDPAEPPEPPLPKPPPELPLAPVGPVVTAPDPHELLKACKEASFTDCFRVWQPPPPPPEPEKKEAKSPPPPAGPADPKAPREPAQPGALTGGKPPAPNPEADQATYEALVKAIKDAGLDGKVRLPDPPKDGSATMKLDPTKQKAPAKP